ncbi:MAG: YncE family protein [Burkholderiaceae bacterium]
MWIPVAARSEASVPPERMEQGGIAVSLSIASGDAGGAVARIDLTDAASGIPIRGARPAAWMLRRRSEQVANEQSCEDKARTLVGGSIGSRADVDLNGWRLVTLNQDGTVAFINPFVGIRNSKLESIVQLPALGHDWVWMPRTQRLFVTLRDAGLVAVIDTISRRLVRTISTGDGSLPTRIVADPGNARVWVGLDGSAALVALDAGSGTQVARVAVGRGLHVLAMHTDAASLFATNSESDSVSIVDRNTLAVRNVAVGDTPVALAWSVAAQRLVALSANGGTLALIDPETNSIAQSVALAPGATQLGLFSNGRYAIVANGRTDRVSLLDLAGARVVAQTTVVGEPDAIAFTREFAYIRSQKSASVRLINLAQARKGQLDGLTVPIGRSAPSDLPEAINVASVMAEAPEGNGIVMANPGDGTVYRYAEGMMAPIGSFSNYRRAARALLVLDSSLAEREPGRFEAATRIDHGGRYDVVVRNLRPDVTACFIVSLAGVPESDRTYDAPKPRLQYQRASAGNEWLIGFSLSDAKDHAIEDADPTLLLVQRKGSWQRRVAARHLGGGWYEARIERMPHGEFEAMVAAPGSGLTFDQARLARLQWPLPERQADTSIDAKEVKP